jgi:predicted ATP-binding protein involved in virulence
MITVKKLFGIFDHEIPLNMDDRITIIHAPNGFGKTIILKMIYGLFNRSYKDFRSIPFKEFKVDFDDYPSICVNQEKVNENDYEMYHNVNQSISDLFSNSEIVFKLTENVEPVHLNFLYRAFYDLMGPKELLETIDLIPEFERVNPKYWIFTPTGEFFSLADILDYIIYNNVLKDYIENEVIMPEWFNNFHKKINIYLIQTQRLQNIITVLNPSHLAYIGKDITISKVETYANDLKEEIKKKRDEFATLSQAIDRTFPTRLVEKMENHNHQSLTNDQLNDELKKLEKRRLELREAGLFDEDKDMNFLPPEKTSEYTKEVLVIYMRDVEKKLSVFNEIASKIHLFKKMINKRFQYKEIYISKESGFHFVSSDGTRLPLNALSSGEQHELVMLYQLLFKTQPDSLILIDEPEMSLHVAWQVQFLKDFLKIAKLAELDIILATHSPEIIYDRWDLTVELKAPDSK